jgi:phage terminase large subunit-like protein
MPWQQHALVNIFGWLNPDGTRRIRSAYITIGKKNYKSTFASSLSLYMLLDGEPGAQVYLAAAARDQTDNVFLPAVGMVRASPALRKQLKIIRNRITTSSPNSFLRALSTKDDTSQGVDAYLVIVDELHVWRTIGQVKFFHSLRFAGSARQQPLFLMITTRGDDQETLCGQEDAYAIKVATGEAIDITHYAAIYAPTVKPTELTILSDEIILAANPVLAGRKNKICELIREFEQARAQGPTALGEFLRYRLNMWTSSAVSYISAEQWAACAAEIVMPTNRPRAWVGFDLASREDIASYSIIFEREDLPPGIITRHFCPSTKVEKEAAKGNDSYFRWAKSGDLFLCDGEIIKHDTIKDQMILDFEKFDIQSVGFDRWNADQLSHWCEQELGLVTVPVAQSFRTMNAPCRKLYQMVISQQVAHDNNAVMNYMVENTLVSTNTAEYMMPMKKHGRKKYKIDGVIATLIAMVQYAADHLDEILTEVTEASSLPASVDL